MNNYIMSTNILLVRNEAYMQLLTVDISEEGIANDSGTLLTILLKDRTTNKNIVWASPSYEGMGKPFCANQPIKKNLIIGPYASIIQPRVEKINAIKRYVHVNVVKYLLHPGLLISRYLL